MIINDETYSDSHFSSNNVYFFSIGYEHRSYHLYEKIKSNITNDNSICFVFDDYKKYAHASNKIHEIKGKNIQIKEVNYSFSQVVQNAILSTLAPFIVKKAPITIHIDYSSMPRSWYCNIAIVLRKILRCNDQVYFWYSEGVYPNSYKEYPSAGIDAFSFFSGMPSLQVDKKRSHILAIGYDRIRTQAIVSILDPKYLVTCYAYNTKRKEFQQAIKQVNSQTLTNSALSLALHIDEFSFMISKLREVSNELLVRGDVILIPDGPKPLIFAMSLVPTLIDRNGLSCMHVSRNKNHFNPVDVTASGYVYGFSMRIINDTNTISTEN